MGIYASPSGLLIAERDPTLALYPIALNDFATGNFLDAVTNINATTSGGSTLTGQAKFRNDYQRLTSTFPSLGYRASPAWTNLLYELNADAPSFEGGTTGGWAGGRYTNAIITTDAWHGSRSLQGTVNNVAGDQYETITVTAGTAAGTQYTFAAMVKAGNAGAVGNKVYARTWDDVTGYTSGAQVTLTTEWQLVTVTATYNAASTVRQVYIYNVWGSGWLVGDVLLIDAISLVAGATVPMFEEAECTATSCTFPTPFTAGEPVSFLFFVWTPWAGNDATLHQLLDNRSGASIVQIYK
ncbi:MAG: hypothetical protein M0R06_25245, partial [Sphaerochaeta sp.]|nr:hypothetical protein [Sphaerochaeta sp.]